MFFKRNEFKRTVSCAVMLVLLLSCVGCSFFGDQAADTSSVEATAESDAPVVDHVFGVKGRKASLLISALENAGVSMGEGTVTKTIYVGDHDNDLTASAKEKVRSRENYYNDYVIMSSEDSVAVYGGSDDSLERAIAYFAEQYVEDGKISVTDGICDLVQAKNSSFTVAGRSVKGLRVVAKDKSYQTVAASLARSLSQLTGYPVTEATTAGSNDLTLVAQSNSNKGEFEAEYTVSVEDSQLTLSAPTLSSLSYAVQCFLNGITDGTDLPEGMNEKRTYTMKHADATNTELFKYCGMWEATDAEHPTAMVSYWNASYVEIDFTGNAITLEFSKESTFFVKMDGEDRYSSSYTVDGKITLFAEGDGPHTVRIYNNDRLKHLSFAGASVESNAELTRTKDKALYVQFIGDSITENMVKKEALSFACDSMGLDFGAAAYSGMALETDYGYWHVNNGYDRTNNQYTNGSMAQLIKQNFNITKIGMEKAFFKLGVPDNQMQGEERTQYAENYYTSDFDCNYESGNSPDVIFIFLGTNDELHRTSDAERFKQAYIDFVEKIFETYGQDVQVVVLQAISNGTSDPNEIHPYYTCIGTAGDALEKMFPNNVTFINRDVIEQWNIEISDDKIHPTLSGYNTLATNVAKLLSEMFIK